MIPQKHADEMQQRTQTPSPVDDKQKKTTPIAPQSRPAPPLHRRWRQVLLPILSVALPMIAGSMISWPWGVGDILDSFWVFWTVFLGTCLMVFVGATWLRSPWALLIVPVAWVVGEILGAALFPFIQGGWPALHAEIHFWDAQGTIIPFGLLIVVLFTLFGTALGTWLKEREPRR